MRASNTDRTQASLGTSRARRIPLALALVAACARVEAPAPLAPLEVPAPPDSMAPVLSAGADGTLRLAWTEPRGAGEHALCFSELADGSFGPARTIARGPDWFVNWADVPALADFSDGTLVATWLAKLGAGTYAYGVQWALSRDGGATWEERGLLHEDDSAGEHGFVSLAALDDDTLRAVWLDGAAAAGGHDHGGHGAMAVHARTLSRTGELGLEVELDARVCDCCPTAQVALADGSSLALYRDRGEDERRDVALVAFDAGGAHAQREFARDGWIVEGCPVNGPVLARAGDLVAAAWFTRGGDDTARVLAAFSRDGGASFSAAVELARGEVLGALSGAFDATGAFRVAWLARDGEGAHARGWWALGGAHPEHGVVGEPIELVETVPARVSGIARLVEHDGELWFAWTEVAGDGTTRVRCARVAPSGA